MKLKGETLYFGDNGRVFCAKIRCAGMTAHATGRGISGQRVEQVSGDDLTWAACESCNLKAPQHNGEQTSFEMMRGGRHG